MWKLRHRSSACSRLVFINVIERKTKHVKVTVRQASVKLDWRSTFANIERQTDLRSITNIEGQTNPWTDRSWMSNVRQFHAQQSPTRDVKLYRDEKNFDNQNSGPLSNYIQRQIVKAFPSLYDNFSHAWPFNMTFGYEVSSLTFANIYNADNSDWLTICRNNGLRRINSKRGADWDFC